MVFGFALDRPGACVVVGHLEVTAGGSGNDIQAIIFSHDAFINWRNNGQWQPLFASPAQTLTTLNVPVRQAGTYYLILSNQMSVAAGKTVSGTSTVRYIGYPTPTIAEP